jgi:phage-related protein
MTGLKKTHKKLQDSTTFINFAPMKRKIRTYGGYFESFMETLSEKEQEKVQYGLLLLKTQGRLPKKFVKLIRDGIFELRTEYAGNIYRVFFIFDEDEIVVLFNGFQKKSQKTPQGEIEKALKIKEAYYADKQSQDR